MVIACEELGMRLILEWRPVAAHNAIASDNGLKDAPIVVSLVAVLGRQHYVATLVTYQVFIVGWNH